MSKYELTPPEKATMKFFEKKGGAFGLKWTNNEYQNYQTGRVERMPLWMDGDRGLLDEAAYTLMCRRVWKKLAKQWDLSLSETLHIIASRLHPGCNDMLAVMIAALGDKR